MALLVVLCFATPVALGQCPTLASPVSTWTDGNGNWNNGGNWDSGIPNSATTSACIIDGTSTVTLDTSPAIADLQLASGNTLNFNGGTQLSVYGTQIINAGQINVNGGGGSNTHLYLDNSVTLSGGGTLTLSTTAASGGAAWLYQNSGYTLDNVNNTIQGEGYIYNNGATIINEAGGTINANSAGGSLITPLYLEYGNITNGGTLEATNSGVLQLFQNTINNAGGNITSNGADVQVYNATIQGGTLNNNTGGTMETIGTSVLDGSTQGALTLSTGSTYTTSSGYATEVFGTINNQGNFQVNGGGGSNTHLYLDNSVTLSGGGTLTLSTTAASGGASWLYQNSGYTLDNVNNTIQGEGYIYNNGATIVNEAGGTINANSTGSPLTNTLYIQYGNITNSGLMEATNNGVLQLYSNTINNAGANITASGSGVLQLFYDTINNAGGTITANGAGTSMQLLGTTIQGGTLGGMIEAIGGTSVLDGSTYGALTLLSGSSYTLSPGSVTEVLGTINNQGNFQVNGGGNSNTYMYTIGNTTLQGGGTLTLNTTTTGGGGTAYLWQYGAYTLDNVNNTIQGEGVIYNNGATLINEAGGTINANSTGAPLTNTLYIQYGNITNSGLLEATNNGVLQLYSNTINNAGANITATDSGVLQLFYDTINNAGGTITANGAGTSMQLLGTTIQGGTLGGTIEAIGGTSVLDGSTYGALTLLSGSSYTLSPGSATEVLGTINNPGIIQVNGGGNSNTYMYTIGNTTLQGGGTLTLNTTTTGGGGTAYLWQYGAYTLDNVNNTIQGEGVIYNNGATLINEAGGTINANSTGSPLITPLYVEDGNITNGGTLEASNSGVLQLYSNTINNAGGNITASGAGATVQVYDSTIQGGTLNNSTGGTMETIGTSVLDGSTQGVLTLSAGSTYTTSTGYTTYVLGTINNQGNFQVNGGGGSDTYLRTEDNTTLQGGGTVTLSTTTTGGGGYARLYNNGGYTLDNLNNTIQGEGVIYNNGATLINEAGGVINANSTGGALSNTLSIQDGNITNSGSMEATNNGVLQLYATTVNNAGGNITANAGATVQIFGGADIQGGTLTNNGAFLGTPQNNQAILDGSTGAGAVTINGTYTSALSTQTYLLGTINNQGNIQVNGGSGASTYLWVDSSNVTLTGGGTVTLSSAAGGGSANINQTAGGYTLTNLDNTIQGVGTINVANVTNSGTIIAGTAGNPGTINIIGNYTQTGTGIYNELIGSSTSNGLLNISGLATLGSGSGTGLNISLLNNYDPASGSTFTIMNYGSLASGSALNINPADLNFGPGNDQQWLISYNGNNVVLTAESLVPGTVTATWTTGTGSWTTASQWSCVPGPSTCVPGNGGGTVYDTGLNAPGNTLTLPTGNSITVDTLALQGGTLTIQSGASLDLANQPAGITDIPSAAGLIVAGSFTTTGGTTSALAGLTSVEGYLELDGQTITDTPGGTPPTLTVASGAYAWLSGTNLTVNGNVANSGDTRVNGGSTLTVNGDLTNSHYLFTGVGGSGDTLTVSGTLTNNAGGSTWIGYNGAGGDVANVNALANNGYLYIGSGATLNITGGGQGVTDVVAGSSLNLYGTFELSGNPSQSALGNLTNVEGFMLLGNGQNISVTPGGSPATLTLASNGYVQVRYGTDWTVNGTVNNAGNLYLYDSGTTANFTALTNTGTTYISPGTTLNLTNGITDMPGQLYVYGTINSGGSSALAGLTSVEGGLYLANGQTLSITPGGSPATLTNSGVFAIGGGTNVTVNGNVNNSYDFSTDYNVGGGGNTLNVTGTFNNNAGQFLVWGPGDQATVNALNNAASAYVQVNQGATLTSNTTLNNAGYIYLYNGTTLNVNGAGTSSNSGNVYLYGGTLAGNNASANFNNTGLISTQGGPSQPSTLNFAGTFTNGPGGTLNLNYSGDQATTPTLGNGGTVTVASGALLGVGTGTFAAGGGFQQLANGTLNEIIQNTSPSGFGILNITGPVSLAGALNVTLLSGFDPTGDTFDILNYTGSLTGAFTNGTLFTADGYQWTLTYGSGDVLLSAGAIPGLVAATWSAGSGNWTNALQWGCNPVYAPCVPNNNGVTAFTATLDSPGQTLALDSTSTPTSITIDSLSLVAGTLDIGSGATLNLANRPGGITDIPSAAGLIVAGTFTAGANSALVGLTSVEGYVELDNAQTTAVTPGGSPATLTVASGGDLRVNNGSTLTVNGNLTNSGDVYTGVGYTAGNTLTVSGAYTNNGLTYEGYSNTSDLVNVGSLTNNGELVIDPNATFNITGGGQGITDAVAGSTLYLYGTFELGGNPSQSALGNLTSVEGYVELDNAQTTATAPNGGTLTVASTGDLRVNNGSTLTVTGNLTNSGLIYTGVGYSAGNTLNVSGAFTNNLDASTYVGYNSSADQMNVGSLANAGYIQVDNGSSLNIAGSTDTNSGTIALYGATLSSPSPSGNFDNTGTVRTISGPASTVAIGGTFTNEAGANLTLNNSGDVAKIGNLANGGTVTVAAGALLGVGTGTFTATSGFQQLSSGTLTELIGSASSWGVLNITGPVSLAGALNITLLNSFDPTGNTFDILNYTGTLTGAFSNGTNFSADGYNWTLTYGTGDVLLTAGAIPGLVAATWSTGSGNWTNTAEWGCNPTYSPCMPNNTSPTAFTAEIDSPGQTLALNGSSSPMSITINSLSLVAGTLDIGTGTTLNLANQPSGIMDIPLGAGLDVAGTFTAGANSALANLGSVEGTLTLESQTLTATPGTPPFSNSGAMNLQQTTALTISGDLSNSGTINTGNGASDTGSNSLAVSGTLTNSGNIYMHGVGDSLSADLTNSGNIELLANNQTLTDTGDFNNTGGLLSLTGNTDTVTVAGNLTNTGTVQMLGTNGSIAVTLGLSNSGDIYIGAGGGNKLTMGTWNNLSGSGNLTGGGHYDIGGLFEYSAPANGITSIGSGVEVTLRPGGLITPDGTTDALAGLASNAGELELVNHSESFTPAGSPGTFSNSGNLYLSNNSSSATLTVNGNFHNSGLTQLYGSAAQGLSVTGNSSNEGTIAMYGPGDSFSTAGTLTNSGTIGMYGTGESLSADLTNTGAINLNGNNDMLTDTEDFNNNSGGSLHLTADLNSVSVSGNFNNNSGASVTMSGTNGSISVLGAGGFTNGGSVSLTGSHDTLNAASFANTGNVAIGATETVSVGAGAGTYTQTAGTTRGTGTIVAGNVNIKGGTIQPGAPGAPGTLAITGNYTQGSGGTLIIDLGGTGAGQFSLLNLSGNAMLDGTVDFALVGGFTPTAGEDFTFLTWGGTESGNFANMDFTNWSCPAGDTCTDVLGSNSLTLEINGPTIPPTSTPEPSVFLLLAMGIALMSILLKYRNTLRSTVE